MDDRAEGAIPIHAMMAIEAFVLGRDKGGLNDLWNVVQFDHCPALQPDFGDEAPVGGVEFGRLLGGEFVERGGGWAAVSRTNQGPGGKEGSGTDHDNQGGGQQEEMNECWVPLKEGATLAGRLGAGGRHGMNLYTPQNRLDYGSV